MDLSQATAHFGLSARATATRHGVTWRPRIGVESQSLPLPDAAVAASWAFTLPAVAGTVDFEVGDLWTINLGGAHDTIAVSGITGTGAGSLNVTYDLLDTLVAGMPAWQLGSALLRWQEGFWTIFLSGVAQFRMKRPSARPSPGPSDWEIASGGSATGLPQLVLSTDGAVPVLVGGKSQNDFENQLLATDLVQGLLLHCTAGRIAYGTELGALVLSAGQHFQLGLPGGPDADFLGEFITVLGCMEDSAFSLTVLTTSA
jgi:hypothetical protein